MACKKIKKFFVKIVVNKLKKKARNKNLLTVLWNLFKRNSKSYIKITKVNKLNLSLSYSFDFAHKSLLSKNFKYFKSLLSF